MRCSSLGILERKFSKLRSVPPNLRFLRYLPVRPLRMIPAKFLKMLGARDYEVKIVFLIRTIIYENCTVQLILIYFLPRAFISLGQHHLARNSRFVHHQWMAITKHSLNTKYGGTFIPAYKLIASSWSLSSTARCP